MQPLKDLYTPLFIQTIADRISEQDAGFASADFSHYVLDEHWDGLSLKQRMRHITDGLGQFLLRGRDNDFEKSSDILCRIISHFSAFEQSGLICLCFPDFIEQYGLQRPDISLPALKHMTEFSSAEFAIRPFIRQDVSGVMAEMGRWATDDNHHIRRLASEGCRPKLPWGGHIIEFVQDPDPIFPILDRLKTDDSLYVRKSVANNLNDISKDHPDRVIKTVQAWGQEHPHTKWILKHGCRGLLKQGRPDVLPLFDFLPIELKQVRLSLKSDQVLCGGDLEFSFSAQVCSALVGKLRLEYRIEFFRPTSDKPGVKVFQWGEQKTVPQTISGIKKQSFKDLSTRKHYAGPHKLTVIVNGTAVASAPFDLIA